MSIDPLDFRQALGRFASGVTVVTMRDRDAVHGITVSAFLSLSLRPPLVGIAIDEGASAHPLLLRLDSFCVSVLREDQRGVSDRFANRPVDGVDIRFDEFHGECAIAGSLARLACHIVDRVPTGDHTFVVGEIEALEVDEGEPLVYFRSDYRRLT